MSKADTLGPRPVLFEMTSNNKHHRERSVKTDDDNALFSASRKQPGSASHSLVFRVSKDRVPCRNADEAFACNVPEGADE